LEVIMPDETPRQRYEREWAAIGFESDEYRTMRYATAIHEAGHAVIGRVLGMLCGDTTIVPDDDSGGHGIIHDPDDIDDAWKRQGRYRNFSSVYVGRIMSFMAGAEAEIEILGEYQGADEDDRHQIARMMMSRWLHIPGYDEDRDGSAERFEARLRARTRGLVRRHRGKIERIAAALLVRRTLTAEEVEAVLRE
jgi:ATP-dependent Zn protease